MSALLTKKSPRFQFKRRFRRVSTAGSTFAVLLPLTTISIYFTKILFRWLCRISRISLSTSAGNFALLVLRKTNVHRNSSGVGCRQFRRAAPYVGNFVMLLWQLEISLPYVC